MPTRIMLLFASAFFIVMNVLLWRTEIFKRGEIGSPVPVRTVYEKILNAADISSLEIQHRGERIGYCRWMATVGEGANLSRNASQELPEGMVREPIGYTLDLNGHFEWDEANRFRFTCDLRLATNYAWQEFNFRLQLRPQQWELRLNAAEQTARLTMSESGQRDVREFKLADLQRPEKILRELGGPLLPSTLQALGVPLNAPLSASSEKVIQWGARQDWMRVGRSRIRVYRLQAQFLDRFQAAVIVSPAGELLRIELPEQLVLVNDALASF